MTFTSAVLGAVHHPTNILTEYLSKFRGVKKFKAYLLSWFDGWIYKKLQEGKPPWIYVVSQELAEALGCCRDTVFRHLKDLCEMGILKKSLYKRWAIDNIWAYTINFERLKQELAPLTELSTNENQTALSPKSDSQGSDFVQPTAEIQIPYISHIPNSSPVQPQHDLPAAGEKGKQDDLTHREESATGKKVILLFMWQLF